jgi:hypothetical protein
MESGRATYRQRIARSAVTRNVVYKFFQASLAAAAQGHRLISPKEYALLMIGMGLVVLLAGTVEYPQDLRS